MAIEYYGLNYFPLLTQFFHCNAIELLAAIFGIKGPYATIMLLCKIYADGYYIQWGEEQNMIFARKLGPEYNKETVAKIVNTLIEKGFFHKESYEKFEILTSTDIQKVWMEATSRRKRDLNKLPYLLIECTSEKKESKNSKKESKKHSKTTENVDSMQTEMELNSENADIFEQSKVKQSKVEQSKEFPPSNPPTGEKMERYEDNYSLLPPPPEYALNKTTHNYSGLLETLKLRQVREMAEIKAIIKFSDYGRKGTEIWKLLANTHWNRIEAPGKYIIKVLRTR
ncbi:DUF4373 domain-containing protein [Bacteroides sp.]